jgi:CRISPR/Cas system-associated exonuclease Cas4 (RecB family)
VNICSIDDLKRATPEQIEETKKKVTVAADLERYLNWLGEGKATTEFTVVLSNEDRSLGIHPSTVSHKGTCPLRVYYECTGELPQAKNQFDTTTRLIFDLGTSIHCMLQTHFHNMYKDQFESEVKLTDEKLHIKSSSDGLFKWSFARVVLEIKSINEAGFEKVQNKPQVDHVRQSTCYMKLSNTPFAIVFYFCKNNSKYKEHILTYSEQEWATLEQEIQPVVDAAYNGGPMVQPKTGNCFYCPFTYNCAHSERRNSSGTKTRQQPRPVRLRPSNGVQTVPVLGLGQGGAR